MPATSCALSHPLADLYVARALDPVIALARALSGDFVRRPQQHTGASPEETTLLTNFRLLYGKHPEWPDEAQRSYASAKPLNRLSQPFATLRLAAIRYVQGASAPGAAIARRSFTESAELLRATVRPLEGAPLSAVAEAYSAMLKRAVATVSSERMAAAFGVTNMAASEEPQVMYRPPFAYLCESMSQTLGLGRPLWQPLVSSLQGAAQHGAATIVGVCASPFADSDDDRFAEVISSAVAWATDLGGLLGHLDVARAWTDPAYRSRLFPLERDLLPPHPAGEISLEGTVRTAAARFSSGSFGFSTHTVAGEVCCCTGSLPDRCGPSQTYAIEICPADSNGQCCPDTGTEDPTLTNNIA
jgi:mersacidin/lichenicidin family type 2 lantibiotic